MTSYKSITRETCEKAIELHKTGLGTVTAAKKLDLSPTTLRKALYRFDLMKVWDEYTDPVMKERGRKLQSSLESSKGGEDKKEQSTPPVEDSDVEEPQPEEAQGETIMARTTKPTTVLAAARAEGPTATKGKAIEQATDLGAVKETGKEKTPAPTKSSANLKDLLENKTTRLILLGIIVLGGAYILYRRHQRVEIAPSPEPNKSDLVTDLETKWSDALP